MRPDAVVAAAKRDGQGLDGDLYPTFVAELGVIPPQTLGLVCWFRRRWGRGAGWSGCSVLCRGQFRLTARVRLVIAVGAARGIRVRRQPECWSLRSFGIVALQRSGIAEAVSIVAGGP